MAVVRYDGNGGGDLRRWRTGEDDDDPETKGVATMGCMSGEFEGFSKRSVRDIYTHMLSVVPSGTSRWHRDAKLLAVAAAQ